MATFCSISEPNFIYAFYAVPISFYCQNWQTHFKLPKSSLLKVWKKNLYSQETDYNDTLQEIYNQDAFQVLNINHQSLFSSRFRVRHGWWWWWWFSIARKNLGKIQLLPEYTSLRIWYFSACRMFVILYLTLMVDILLFYILFMINTYISFPSKGFFFNQILMRAVFAPRASYQLQIVM